MFKQARTRVKICGLTRAEDIEAAVQAGADAIGLVLYPSSKRAVGVDQAAALRKALPAFVDLVALFVNASRDEVDAVIQAVQPEMLQFHGDESPAYCESFHRRYVKAFRVGAPGLDTPESVLQHCEQYGSAAGWLFDSYSAGYGGSGKSFDTALLCDVSQAPHRRPLILAGGLNAESAREAIASVRPYAVDISSGVEQSPGVKCPDKIASFMAAVSAA